MRKNKRRPVKPVISDKVYNIHHPDFHGKIEEAFKAAGKQYYCFTNDSGMKYGRYIFMQNFLQEMYLRIDLNSLRQYAQDAQSWINGSKTNSEGKPLIRVDKACEILSIIDQRANLSFEPDTVFRLASCIYFDANEDLKSWDKKYNEAKIELWREAKAYDFFFHKLFQELTDLRGTSLTVLENYLEKIPPLIKGWSKIVNGTLTQ